MTRLRWRLKARRMRRVIVEDIPWLYACCDSDITAADVASASRFQNERRRTEHLAWRRVVRRELGRGVEIGYNEVGAPTLNLENMHLSVAHGAGLVAVVISDKKVGIDIESLERDFASVSSRYMSVEEQALSTHKEWGAMVWCAKEALYKLYGERGLDLKHDIVLTDYNHEEGVICAMLCQKSKARVEVSLHDTDAVVAVAEFE